MKTWTTPYYKMCSENSLKIHCYSTMTQLFVNYDLIYGKLFKF